MGQDKIMSIIGKPKAPKPSGFVMMLKAFGVDIDPEEIKRNIEMMRTIALDAANRLQRIEDKLDIAIAQQDGVPEIEDRFDAIARALAEKNDTRRN